MNRPTAIAMRRPTTPAPAAIMDEETMRTCPLCTQHFANFLPIPEPYVRQQQAFGVTYSLDDFETLNLGQYLCPVCGAMSSTRSVSPGRRARWSRTYNAYSRSRSIAPHTGHRY
jgi:hypothetical protein